MLLPQDCLTENWTLVNDCGIFRYPGCFELASETKVDKEMHVDKRTSV